MKKLCSILTIIFIMAFALAGCSSSSGNNVLGQESTEEDQASQVDNNPEPATLSSLSGFTSNDELEQYIKTGLLASTSEPVYKNDDALDESADAATASPQAAGPFFSTTNIQESGVDEADTIKSDGKYLYIAPAMVHYFILEDAAVSVKTETDETLDSSNIRDVVINRDETIDEIPVITSNADEEPLIAPAPVIEPVSEEEVVIAPNPEKSDPVIRILELKSNPAGSKEIAQIATKDFENHVDGLYLLQNRGEGKPDLLVTIGGNAQNIWADWYCPWCWQNGISEIVIFNVDSPANPQKISHIKLDGQLISSRRIGEMLYLVTRYTPNLPDFKAYPVDDTERTENEQVLEKASLFDMLPRVDINGTDQGALIKAEQCYLPPANEDQNVEPNLITVTAINLNAPEDRLSQSIAGPAETFYMSTKSLYLATTRYPYQPLIGLPEIAKADTESLVPATTDLHKFSLTENGPVYKGSGTVKGHLGWEPDKKPFRMSEYNEILRIATSLGDSWNETSSTRLTLLTENSDNSLKETAYIDNIGKTGESLYAVRFIGTRGYLVTFKVTDPFYVFDLSDPYNPVQTGELSIQGYSDYLHPINENLILGIGKDAVPDTSSDDFGGRGAWYQGIKLSLFDVSNPANPYELKSLVIGKRGTETGVLYNHHALAYVPSVNGSPAKLALPVSLHETPFQNNEWYDYSQPQAWYDWTSTGLYLFEINTSEIINTGKMIIADRSQNKHTIYDDITSARSVLVDDDVHYIHNTKVWSATWQDPYNMSGPK